jgi:hypothetical protein
MVEPVWRIRLSSNFFGINLEKNFQNGHKYLNMFIHIYLSRWHLNNLLFPDEIFVHNCRIKNDSENFSVEM